MNFAGILAFALLTSRETKLGHPVLQVDHVAEDVCRSLLYQRIVSMRLSPGTVNIRQLLHLFAKNITWGEVAPAVFIKGLVSNIDTSRVAMTSAEAAEFESFLGLIPSLQGHVHTMIF